MYDVMILGAGIAGATAALRLSHLNTAVVEAESFTGGRTLSRDYPEALWANFGAQYLSDDKVRAFAQADEVDAELLPLNVAALRGDYLPDYLDKDDIKEVRAVIRRINREQQRPREPADPELDQVSFKDWLGEVRPNVAAYWDMWCTTYSCPPERMSLYGVMLLHGMNRVSAFDEPVPTDPRGASVLVGGTAMLARKSLEKAGVPCFHNSRVIRVSASESGGYTVVVETPQGEQQYQTRSVVSALPAPVVLDVFDQLPEHKTAALRGVVYNRIIGLPVVIGPKNFAQGKVYKAPFREGATYCETLFGMRSPTDFDNQGGFYVSQIYDECSRVVWDDDDDSIRAGVYHAFVNTVPEFKDRIVEIGVHRWRYGLPQYNLGRMAREPVLREPVLQKPGLGKKGDGIYFCGDYTDLSHTEGAIRSAERAVGELLKDREVSRES